jgi:hypothetical protein
MIVEIDHYLRGTRCKGPYPLGKSQQLLLTIEIVIAGSGIGTPPGFPVSPMQAEVGQRGCSNIHDRRVSLYLGKVEGNKGYLKSSQGIEGTVVIPLAIAKLDCKGYIGKKPYEGIKISSLVRFIMERIGKLQKYGFQRTGMEKRLKGRTKQRCLVLPGRGVYGMGKGLMGLDGKNQGRSHFVHPL